MRIREAGLSRRRRVYGRGLRADLRAMLPDAAAALVVTAGIFAWLYIRVVRGTSATVAVMPMLADANTYWLYWLCQAFGWSGLLWAWITIMLGLSRSSTRPGWLPVSGARIERWHRTTSLTTVGLMFAHALAFFVELVRANQDDLAWSGRLWTSFAKVFVPGVYSSGTGEVAILLGLLAFYLAIPLSLAYYFRHITGARAWQVLHRFVIVVYVLSVWHTLLYGTNVWYEGWFRTLVWALQLPIAALLLSRLLAPARRRERLHLRDGARRPSLVSAVTRLAGRGLVAAGIVVLLAVTVTGRDGGRTPGAESSEPVATVGVIWVGLVALLLAIAAAVYRARRFSRASTPPRTSGRSTAPLEPEEHG